MQYLIITYSGKKYEKEYVRVCVCVCVCVTETLFCKPETNTF